MPKFSEKSIKQLQTCDIDLQILFKEVIKYFDCSVVEGYRNEKDQNKAFEEGKSQLPFPKGNHNTFPSKAVDVYPYPIDFEDSKRFYYFAGFVKGMAALLKAQGKIRNSIKWGGNWSDDTHVKYNNFNDLVHFEIY